MTAARVGRIAEQSGLSRATLYRYFRTKDDLIRAYAEREAFLSQLRLAKRIGKLSKLSDRLVEAIAFTVESIRNEPAIAPFFAPDAMGVTGAIPFRSAAMIENTRANVQVLIDGADGSECLKDGVRVDELAEWLVRLGLSLAMVPGPDRKPQELRAFVRRLVVPAFVE